MRTEELDFPLPEGLVARHPPTERRDARLLTVRCGRRETRDRQFPDLADELREGDLLVLNDTRVVPARFEAHKPSGGRVEGLWLGETTDGLAECMLSGSRLRPGVELLLTSGGHRLRLANRLAPGRWLLEDGTGLGWLRVLADGGSTPLPPYIRSRRRAEGEAEDSAADRSRYQTVFARSDGAVAAPTASLHFDAALLEALTARGVRRASLTLHVGAGTFLPIATDDPTEHPIHAERYEVPSATARALASTRREGGRIVAAGTTVCRALESLPEEPTAVHDGSTDLFLTPGHTFRWTDGLLTNFHTPRSTLLLLVAAFAAQAGADGLDFVKRVYAEAVEKQYRFYSYGDASLWFP